MTLRKAVLVASVSAAAVLMGPARARAADRWEQGSIPVFSNDDTASSTRNELRPGDHQEGHDLEGTPAAPDLDYFIVKTQQYHTYEALVRSVTLFWSSGNAFCVPPGGISVCPRFDLVASDGSILTPGVPDGASNHANVSSAWRVMMYGTGTTNYLRVKGDTGGSAHNSLDQYDIVFRDTSYAVPRFNNSATQSTTLIIQNTTDLLVHVDAQLFDGNGALLGIAGQNIAARGVWVYPTTSLAAAQGKSGSILVRQEGPYGALAGKAVAIEPATGFTFDTALAPIGQ
jgi:hypothetical protein